MRLAYAASYTLTACAAVVTLFGCSSAGWQRSPVARSAAPLTHQREFQPGNVAGSLSSRIATARNDADIKQRSNAGRLGAGLVFVSDTYKSVDIYDQATGHTKVGEVTGLHRPQGIATDTAGNIYVANTGDSDVLEYAPPYTRSAILTLTDPGEVTLGVAVADTGLVGVTNLCQAPNCSPPGSVALYRPHETTPCATFADSKSFGAMYFDAFDDAGDLYVDALTSRGTTALGVIRGGCRAKAITLLTTANVIAAPGGIQMDKNDHIAILDQKRRIIYSYATPENDSLGRPLSKTILREHSAVDFAFVASGAALYVSDPSIRHVNAYRYPSGDPTSSIAISGLPFGVAVAPRLSP